jgi:signal transduction histidine kinase/DNA-binding response OmpR family regulator/HPt (histidine-containing phosphotransfer) domain-containing protein
MLRLLAYAGFSLLAFLTITPIFIFYSSLPREVIGNLSYAVVAMVEIITLITIAVAWMMFEISRKAQFACIAALMGLVLVGDLLGLPRLFLVDGVLGSEQAQGTFMGLVVLVTRFLASLAMVLSWHYANKHDQIFVQEKVTIASAAIFAMGTVSMAVPLYYLPDLSFGIAHALENITTLILIPTLIMMILGAGGYLVRFVLKRSIPEAMLCGSALIGVFNHLALFFLAPNGSELAASFIIPSRVLSYSLVLGSVLLMMRAHFRQSYLASSAKSEFLATMSHEIRTPLNGVLGLAQLLRDSKLDDSQLERVNGILSSGRALMALLNDILDMSKIEAGRVDLESRQFYPSDITHDIKTFFSSVAEEKNLVIVCDDGALTDLVFVGDEVRLRQIFWNLMSNAVKFTSKGSVRFEVRALDEKTADREDAAALRVDETLFHFTIVDTGIGISEERLKLIFAPFTQADNSTMRRYGGTGLGLSIARNLTELMGGRMTVDSVEGQGTRFNVWLPFKTEIVKGHALPKPDMQGDSTPEPLRGARVLVVEDNEINANVVGGMLKRHGVSVTFAPNGREAVHAYREGIFDLVLMDAHMPVLDGEGATRHIRELERFSGSVRIPIICLTADAFADRHRDFLAAGMDDVLTKPVDERKLYSTLLRFLRERPRSATPLFSDDIRAESGEEPGSSDGSAPVFHEKTGQQIGIEKTAMDLIDKDRFAEVRSALGKEHFATLINLLPASYEEERDRLIQAASDNDGEALHRAAHTIKGMAANMAALKLADEARNLEGYDGTYGDELRARIAELDKLAEDTVAAMQAELG